MNQCNQNFALHLLKEDEIQKIYSNGMKRTLVKTFKNGKSFLIVKPMSRIFLILSFMEEMLLDLNMLSQGDT